MSHDRWEQVRLTLSPEVPIGEIEASEVVEHRCIDHS
jgi:hypothetical protein